MVCNYLSKYSGGKIMLLNPFLLLLWRIVIKKHRSQHATLELLAYILERDWQGAGSQFLEHGVHPKKND